MPISKQQRERYEDDTLFDRRITSSLYCSRCGYNLHSLPKCHQCPECGNEYNARSPEMKGIFILQATEFPFGDVLAGLLCAAGTVLMIASGWQAGDDVRMVLGVFFGLLAIVMFLRAYRGITRYAMAYRIIRRIAREEE